MIRTLAIASAALVLAGCTARDEFDPWGQRGVIRPENSATLARVTGGSPSFTPLLPEEGNVWPVEEAPRATLLNLEDQQRGIQPGNAAMIPPPQQLFRQDAVEFQQGSSQVAPPMPPPTRERAPAPTQPLPPVLNISPPATDRLRALPPATPPAGGVTLPPALNISPPTNDRVRTLPGGATVVSPPGSPSTFTTPGGGSGIAVPQGPDTLLIGPGGRIRQVPGQ
ncbi:hypothetical protein ACQW02_19475 [Humitalea sp. 24SJ18S-53]|uniref:hypothetical protein n=1 Tax=Humitalea sp. 24SJ18S-53 TaxID=3422307 RepID=UPI003D666D87